MNRQEFNACFGIGAQHEKLWRTADNETIPFSKVTHQHWSNIYWYHLIFQRIKGMPVGSMQKVVDLSKKEIDERFKGKILEWRPMFTYEIMWLNELGMLKGGTNISDNGKKIGTILTKPMRIVSGFTH